MAGRSLKGLGSALDSVRRPEKKSACFFDGNLNWELCRRSRLDNSGFLVCCFLSRLSGCVSFEFTMGGSSSYSAFLVSSRLFRLLNRHSCITTLGVLIVGSYLSDFGSGLGCLDFIMLFTVPYRRYDVPMLLS